LFFIINFN